MITKFEDAGTVRLVRRARATAASGREVLLPMTVVDRLATGENPIRVLREWRDMTQLELAFKTDISQSYLSNLEKRRRRGAAKALAKIARALKVPLKLLIRQS
jgi:predicted transcriptional regulator